MAALETYSFQFRPHELPHRLSQLSTDNLTGYWLFEFTDQRDAYPIEPWYLGLSQGRVVFSGNQQISWREFLKTLQRYVARLNSTDVKQIILTLEQQFAQAEQDAQSNLFLALLQKLYHLNLINSEELEQALQLKILADFDSYLLQYSGQAKFLPFSQLEIQAPILGFAIQDLLVKVKERQLWWQKLQPIVPMDSVPALNWQSANASQLTNEQKQRLKLLVANGKTINEIACSLAQDSLEVAIFFANLIKENLVTLSSPPHAANPEIFIIDDSPLMLKQFESLVTSWGYTVRSFLDPEEALQALAISHPAAIFLDINMPGITGFDLVKKIRRHPELVTVPLVMLTAEKTLSNNWRARWSGCRFLSKPLASHEISQFCTELRSLLTELVPSHPSHQIESLS